MTVILISAVVVFVVVSAVLCLFALNLLLYSFRTWRAPMVEHPTWDFATRPEVPRITVQLPVFNELYVAERAVRAALALDWPRDRLQIQVLDDSTDETTAIIAAVVAEAQTAGHDIVHLHRQDRTGYKAGALAEALDSATGDFHALFDADFVPPADFLVRAMPALDDPGVAFVQARWGHLNRYHSLMTRLQAIAIDAHFLIDQASRGRSGYWFNFNGTAGIWRRDAIVDAGGWRADTLTEDLDLSYRAHLRGWRASYLQDLVVPAELPVAITGFRRQQHRWAHGSLDCARRLLPRVWQADQPLSTRYQASIHLSSYITHLLILVLVLIYPLLAIAEVRFEGSTNPLGFGWILAIMSITPTVFFLTGQLHPQNRRWRDVPWVFFVSVLGSGLMVNTTRAFVQLLTRPTPAFERTPKFGIDDATETSGTSAWSAKRYTLGLDPIVYIEVFLALYSLACAAFAVSRGNWGIAVFASVFGIGLAGVAFASVLHATARRRASRERATMVPVKKRAMVVMAKRPAAGRTKTRLTPELTEQQAADLYENFLHDIVTALQARDDITMFVAVDEAPAAGWFETFAPGVPQLSQVGDDLGQRLDSVMTACLDRGFEQVFAIGSDSPDLPPEHLSAAFELLDDSDHDVVLGPTVDGGYYLIGWKRRWERLVTDVVMSTPNVLADTLQLADEIGASIAIAPLWYDIDEPDDLIRLRQSIVERPGEPARTAAFLAKL